MLGDVVEALGAQENMRFEVAMDSDLPPVVVDRRLMRQALLNVALNGVQSMPREEIAGKLVVPSSGDHELYFIIAVQGLEVFHAEGIDFA